MKNEQIEIRIGITVTERRPSFVVRGR
jgi:hypothetical protein